VRLFVLPRAATRHVLVVVSLDPPIRKGQTFYPHLLCQVRACCFCLLLVLCVCVYCIWRGVEVLLCAALRFIEPQPRPTKCLSQQQHRPHQSKN
jgi:hypothetical protein